MDNITGKPYAFSKTMAVVVTLYYTVLWQSPHGASFLSCASQAKVIPQSRGITVLVYIRALLSAMHGRRPGPSLSTGFQPRTLLGSITSRVLQEEVPHLPPWDTSILYSSSVWGMALQCPNNQKFKRIQNEQSPTGPLNSQRGLEKAFPLSLTSTVVLPQALAFTVSTYPPLSRFTFLVWASELLLTSSYSQSMLCSLVGAGLPGPRIVL